jgi:hypothetical protein
MLRIPVLILHGTKDSIVPLSDGEALAKKIQRESLYELYRVENGDHNDLFKNHKAKIFKKIREYLNHISKINFQEVSKSDSEVNVVYPNQAIEMMGTKKEDDPMTINIKEIIESDKIEFKEDEPEQDSEKMDDNLDEIKSEDIALQVKSLTVNKSVTPSIHNKSKL